MDFEQKCFYSVLKTQLNQKEMKLKTKYLTYMNSVRQKVRIMWKTLSSLNIIFFSVKKLLLRRSLRDLICIVY